MRVKSFFEEKTLDKSLAIQHAFNPYFNRIESSLAHPIQVEGRAMINLAANNYLGLATHPVVLEAQKAGIEAFGSSMCGTPIATGTTTAASQAEKRFSQFVGVQRGVFFPSCYQANLGLFPMIAGQQDCIIFDHFAHASLLQGIFASKAKPRPFLHNNLEHLEKQLKAARSAKTVFVVTESVFSTEGSIAPLKAIFKLCQRYDAIPVIDDSHGVGVIGKKGRGALSLADSGGFGGIYTASTGKALANAGGFVGGSKGFIEYLQYSCGAYIYSTALAPSAYQGLLAALDILKKDHKKLHNQLNRNAQRISAAIQAKGFPLVEAQAPIVSIDAGSTDQTARITKAFYQAGLFVTPFIPPSVPKDQGKVRIIPGADLGDGVIDEVVRRIQNLSIGGSQ
jgi:7-keto-8-aminopelargonate synthetase-like enzyme